MGSGVESRFECYAERMVRTLGHANRATPARWYLRGLMLPGQRKSVEPMAARGRSFCFSRSWTPYPERRVFFWPCCPGG